MWGEEMWGSIPAPPYPPLAHLSHTNSTQAWYSSMASESALAPAPISESDDGRSFTKASSSWRTLSPWGQSRDVSGQGGWQPKHPRGGFTLCLQS